MLPGSMTEMAAGFNLAVWSKSTKKDLAYFFQAPPGAQHLGRSAVPEAMGAHDRQPCPTAGLAYHRGDAT